jgi:hypothetical protein
VKVVVAHIFHEGERRKSGTRARARRRMQSWPYSIGWKRGTLTGPLRLASHGDKMGTGRVEEDKIHPTMNKSNTKVECS